MHAGDTAWVLLSAALVLFMTPGLALFYGGLVRSKNVLSVVVQVTSFRATGGRRLLRMSPLHHHFELSGWPETRVVVRFAVRREQPL